MRINHPDMSDSPVKLHGIMRCSVILSWPRHLLDRLLHHAVVVQIEGSSYRLRQHADLLAQPRHPGQANTSEPPPRRRGRPPKVAAPATQAA